MCITVTAWRGSSRHRNLRTVVDWRGPSTSGGPGLGEVEDAARDPQNGGWATMRAACDGSGMVQDPGWGGGQEPIPGEEATYGAPPAV